MENLFGEDVPVEYTKDSDFWCTPKEIYDQFMTMGGAFDPCPVNPDFDGLSIPWHGNVFCNPPYSQIEQWVDKALMEAERTGWEVEHIWMLLPNWTDRKWFQKIKRCKIKWYEGRLKFLDPKTGLPGNQSPRFGSMLVTIK